VQSGELEKARDYYLKLTQLEPENQLHSQNYQQVLSKLGTASSIHLITAEEGAGLVDELEATAPFVDQRYPDAVALAVRAALTDAELFVSYNMPAKALGPLLSALPQAPRDQRMNQRLAALHTRAGRFTEAAVCCRTLEGIYHDAGYPDEATRYGELAAKYEERAATGLPVTLKASAEITGLAAAGEAHAPQAVAEAHTLAKPTESAESTGTAEFEIQTAPADEEAIDISAEWEGELAEQLATLSNDQAMQAPAAAAHAAHASPPSDEAAAEAVEEIRFYLANGMVEEARAAFSKFEKMVSDNPKFSAVRHEIESALAEAPATKTEEVSLEEAELPSVTEQDEGTPAVEPGVVEAVGSHLEPAEGLEAHGTAAPVPAEPPAPEPVHASAEPESAGMLNEFVSDLEASLGDEFLAATAAPQEETKPKAEEKPAPAAAVPAASTLAPAPAVHAPAAHAPAAMAAAASQASPAASAAATPTFSYQPTPIQPLAPQAPSTASAGPGVDLASMFGELKQELEEDSAATEEDPETHYNLGVAFREMGLLDEAIGELQKVCQSADHGQPFPHIMQTYTWLAQCFLDKGVPEAAIRWYEKALTLSNLDQDTRTALHYELASSYETAGNKTAALNHFMEVYGSNIDYRDVAERIKTLKS